jgi:hypothetical protein
MFARAGITVRASWVELEENRFGWLRTFDDGDMEGSRKRFSELPEWQAVQGKATVAGSRSRSVICLYQGLDHVAPARGDFSARMGRSRESQSSTYGIPRRYGFSHAPQQREELRTG